MLDETCAEIAELYPFRYRGYYYDSETNLYYLNTRYYDPEVGRFISQDDVSYLDTEHVNGLNLFAYCGNNPVMNVDPSGRFFFTLLSILIATAIAATVSGVVGGITEYANGGSFWNGFVGGAVSGVMGTIGVALGLTFGGVPGLLIATALGAVGDMAINIVQQGLSKGFDNIDGWEVFFSGVVGAVSNLISYGLMRCFGPAIGNTFGAKFINSLKFSPLGTLVGGVVLGFPFLLLSIVPNSLWKILHKGG